MKRTIVTLILVYIITTLVCVGYPSKDTQRYEEGKVWYFYKLAIVNDARDSVEIYCNINKSQDEIDTIFSLPLYKFTNDKDATIYKRLFDSLLLYDIYSSMTLRKNGQDDRLCIGVDFMSDDSTYKTIKGIYLPEVRNKPLLIANVEDSLLTRLELEKSNDSVVVNVHCGDYIFWEGEFPELKVWLKFKEPNATVILGPVSNSIPILSHPEDTLYNRFKWLLDYKAI